MLVVWCTNKLLLELSELPRFVQSLGSVWIQVTQAVEVLRAERLTSGIGHVWSVERVVDDLNSFPVTLGLKHLIHYFLGALIAVGHDPSMEANEPNLLQENFDLAGGVLILVEHIGDLLNANSLTASIATLAAGSLMVLNDTINEPTEVLSNWKINENLLEKYDELLASKATD